MFRAVVLLGLALFAFQAEPSKEVRAKLFQEVLAEDAELRDCLKDQESGARPTEEGITVEEHSGCR